MTLKAKADETTAHIERLVTKQKVTNKKKYAVYRQRPGSGGGRGPSKGYQGGMQYSNRPRPQGNLMPPAPMVPAYLRHQIQDMFKSFPNGLDVLDMDPAFCRLYGTKINFKHYGFMNMYDLLMSIPDSITIQKSSSTEWKVMPVRRYRTPQQTRPNSAQTKQTSPIGVTPHPDQEDRNKKRPSRGRGMFRK